MSSTKVTAQLVKPHVAVVFGPAKYEAVAPYHPGADYPEIINVFGEICGVENNVYDSIRESFRLLNLDFKNFGTPGWNPLGAYISPGNNVVLKPNFVREFRETHNHHENCLITHGSVIRAVLDYAFIALKGHGRLIVADAPQNDADFNAIKNIGGLEQIRSFYKSNFGFNVEIYDLRPEKASKVRGVIVGHQKLAGDPAGYVKVDLGRDSNFAELGGLCSKLYGAEYDTEELRKHHNSGIHEYLIARTILNADCVISLPKLKTHKKSGITVNLKNLVGINGNKNWLPHHREGTPSEGGDQFNNDSVLRKAERVLVEKFKIIFPQLGWIRPFIAKPVKLVGNFVFGDTNTDTIRSGNWFGNDTVWRMVLDLNRILLYSNRFGTVLNTRCRKFFSVVDGIIAGEGNGPLDPIPKAFGVIIAGSNPVDVDLSAARLMGFDYAKMPMLSKALKNHRLPICNLDYNSIRCASNSSDYYGLLSELSTTKFAFIPHFGWKNHIEL